MWKYFVTFVTVNQKLIHHERIQNTCVWTHGAGATLFSRTYRYCRLPENEKWILRCPGLLQRLYDLGYQPEHRSFTPLEVRVIVDALGEP